MAFVTIKDKDNLTLGHLQTDAQERLGVHNLLHVQERKAPGTPSGTFTAGAFRTRALSHVVVNNIVGASLVSSQLVLPAGSYCATWIACCLKVTASVSKLYDLTHTADLGVGTFAYGTSSVNVDTLSVGSGEFTLEEGSTVELQHRGYDTTATNGFGGASVDIGQPFSVYADLKIWKIS